MIGGAPSSRDLLVLYEHPEWQKPLFAALEKRGVSFHVLDAKKAAFEPGAAVPAKVVFNQASPSAYVRGNLRAVPLALAYLKALEHAGVTVLNGSRAFALELSKTAQCAMIRRLGLETPRSIAFNDASALAAHLRHDPSFRFPALLKPEQGGSGARIEKMSSVDEVAALLEKRPDLWQPDGLFLLQELVPYDVERGIVRMEFIEGELLYAMRVHSHGRFNLCPSEVCNPSDGDGVCEVPQIPEVKAPPVEFFPYPEVPREAVDAGRRIAQAAGIDIGGIEYLESEGKLFYYDVNANSNLRPAIAQTFGFDPFERVVDFLVRRIAKA